jgi:hypothetical protein
MAGSGRGRRRERHGRKRPLEQLVERTEILEVGRGIVEPADADAVLAIERGEQQALLRIRGNRERGREAAIEAATIREPALAFQGQEMQHVVTAGHRNDELAVAIRRSRKPAVGPQVELPRRLRERAVGLVRACHSPRSASPQAGAPCGPRPPR